MGGRDAGQCERCGGRLTATYLRLQTCPLDADGCWRRDRSEPSEDVVIACSNCGHAPDGQVLVQGDQFRFVPLAAPAGYV